MLGTSNLRRRGGGGNSQPKATGSFAQAGRYNNGDDDDDWMSPKTLLLGCWYCIWFAVVVTVLVLVAILMHRIVPPMALSDTCDDSNPCTHDFLETVRGVDTGCCSHCNLPNAATCTNVCYDSPQCVDGECKGTCKGHCELSNALDCPKIKAANLTALFDLGGTGRDNHTDSYELRRECALSTCIYTIDINIDNVTYARDAFVVARSKFWRGNNTNISATNETGHLSVFVGWDDFHSNAICLPLISVADRGCMRVIDMDFDQASAPVLDARCTYAYACADPPSYSGEIEFPVRTR